MNFGSYSCSSCGGTSCVDDHRTGDTICTNCGVVVDENLISTEPEWRNFEDTEDKSRVGKAHSIFDYDVRLGYDFKLARMDRKRVFLRDMKRDIDRILSLLFPSKITSVWQTAEQYCELVYRIQLDEKKGIINFEKKPKTEKMILMDDDDDEDDNEESDDDEFEEKEEKKKKQKEKEKEEEREKEKKEEIEKVRQLEKKTHSNENTTISTSSSLPPTIASTSSNSTSSNNSTSTFKSIPPTPTIISSIPQPSVPLTTSIEKNKEASAKGRRIKHGRKTTIVVASVFVALQQTGTEKIAFAKINNTLPKRMKMATIEKFVANIERIRREALKSAR